MVVWVYVRIQYVEYPTRVQHAVCSDYRTSMLCATREDIAMSDLQFQSQKCLDESMMVHVKRTESLAMEGIVRDKLCVVDFAFGLFSNGYSAWC